MDGLLWNIIYILNVNFQILEVHYGGKFEKNIFCISHISTRTIGFNRVCLN